MGSIKEIENENENADETIVEISESTYSNEDVISETQNGKIMNQDNSILGWLINVEENG